MDIRQKYHIMFDNMVQGAFYQRADGTLTDVNPAALAMFGISRDQFLERTSYAPEWMVIDEDGSFMQPDQHPSMAAMRSGRSVRKVVGVYNPAREEHVWMDVNAIPMFQEGEGQPYQVLVTLHDITELKKAEGQLKESELRFRTLLDSLPNIAVQGYDPDGTVRYWNRANESVYGYSEAEAIGKDLVELIIPPEMRDEVRKAIRRGAESGEMPPAGELSLMRKDGSRVPVFSSHAVVRMAGREPEMFCIDIDFSELKRAAEIMRSASAYARTLIEASPDPLVTISPDGTITDVNEASVRVTGISREQLIGTDFSAYFTEPAKAREGYLKVFSNGIVHDYPLAIRHVSGTVTDVLYNASVYRDQDGLVKGVFAAARDVTDRNRAEEKIRKLNEQLENRVRERTAELERMNRELEGFCYAISHEFRAPLARLEGFGTMLMELAQDTGNERIIHSARRIVAAGTRLRTVIDALLAMNRLSRAEIQLQQLDLSEMVRQIVAEIFDGDPQWTARVMIAPEVTARGDRYMVEICLRNLLGNAVKYSSRESEAIVTFGQSVIDGEQVYFVRDNGVGFDMEYAKNLFQPFCRLHNEEEFEGTGVGLATVQRIIERHNGRIWAEAVPGSGATFFFTLGGR